MSSLWIAKLKLSWAFQNQSDFEDFSRDELLTWASIPPLPCFSFKLCIATCWVEWVLPLDLHRTSMPEALGRALVALSLGIHSTEHVAPQSLFLNEAGRCEFGESGSGRQPAHADRALMWTGGLQELGWWVCLPSDCPSPPGHLRHSPSWGMIRRVTLRPASLTSFTMSAWGMLTIDWPLTAKIRSPTFSFAQRSAGLPSMMRPILWGTAKKTPTETGVRDITRICSIFQSCLRQETQCQNSFLRWCLCLFE